MKYRGGFPHLVLVAAVVLAGSALTAEAQTVLRTPEGRPDFQGTWTNKTVTPLQRPADHPSPVLTGAELAAFEDRAEAVQVRLEAGLQAIDPDNRPTFGDGGADLGQAYDEFWWDRGDRVAIVHGEPRASLLTVPADGRIPPFTAEAARVLALEAEIRSRFGPSDHPELRAYNDRCLAFGNGGAPPLLPVGAYNSNYTIVQSPGHLVVMGEMIHDARVIPIGAGPDDAARPHVSGHLRPWGGVSWGWWEGDTLVVETTNGDPRINSLSASALFTEEALTLSRRKITERFSRMGEDGLLYEFLIDDPAVYTEPWGGQIPWYPLGDLVYEYACHEGNYALEAILSGARYEESLEAR